ncbi:hypothetical protein MRA01_16950 [Methylobacterium radiotolerans]|nr:hypothetical protein MRA01_16950 [Methylobacterium radiotolerans]
MKIPSTRAAAGLAACVPTGTASRESGEVRLRASQGRFADRAESGSNPDVDQSTPSTSTTSPIPAGRRLATAAWYSGEK